MNRSVTLSLVVPCYNEYYRLQSNEFKHFLSSNTDIFLCFVNDGSTDKTLSKIDEIHHHYPDRVLILSLAKNVGKAEAVRLGICHVMERVSSDFLGYIDADLATPLIEAIKLTEIAKNQQLIFTLASRVAVFGSLIKRNAFRHYAGRIAATFISIALNMVIYDTQCGLKIFSNTIAAETFSKKFISRWLFDVEIIARIRSNSDHYDLSKVMKEIPIQGWVERGNSKISFYDVLRFPIELLKIARKYKPFPVQLLSQKKSDCKTNYSISHTSPVIKLTTSTPPILNGDIDKHFHKI